MPTLVRLHTFVAGEIPTAAEWNADIDQLITTLNGGLDSTNVALSGATGLCDLASAQTISGIKTISTKMIFAAAYGSYIRIGTARVWYDATIGTLRIKHGSDPSSESDGNALMEG